MDRLFFDRAYIEVSNICNLQCRFCPEVEREKKIMPPELFEKLLIQLKPLVKEITLHLMGEPLAHPQFEELVKCASEQNLPIQLTTNGTLIAQDKKKTWLLNPVFRQINFSIQSLFDNFSEEKALMSLERILDFVEMSLEKRPELYLNLRLWNLSAGKRFEEQNPLLYERLLDRFGFEAPANPDVRRNKSVRVSGRLYLHFDSRFEWPQLSHPVVRERGFCHALKSHFGVLADGTIVPCCLDKEAGISLGQFSGEAGELVSILSSSRARRLRDGFDRFEVQEDLCRRCTFISRFDRKLPKNLS